MGREPSLAASDASGSLMSGAGSLPPRRFLVDGRRSGRERDSDGGDGGAMPRNTSVPMMNSPSGMLGPQRSLSTTPELVEEGSVASPRPASGGRPSSGGLPPLPPAPSVPAPSAEPAALEVMSSALTAAASSISVFPCLVPRGDVPVLSRLNARANPGELPADGASLGSCSRAPPYLEEWAATSGSAAACPAHTSPRAQALQGQGQH